MRLEHKVAIITGAASGIGRASAQACARQGARIIAGDIEHEAAEQTAQAIRQAGGEAISVMADVSRSEDVQRMVRQAIEAFGAIDVLHNNAGIAVRHPVDEQDEAGWDELMRVNLRSVFLCSKYVIPHMQARGGSIINMSSVVGVVGVRNRAAYSTTKGAILTLTKNMALDYASAGIRVNCICPGFTETAMTAALFADPERRRRLVAMHPLGRLGKVEDIANAVVFLASDEASWITGQALAVDGGFTIGNPTDI